MPKNRIIIVTGFFISLLPVLGFPHAWESFFQVVGGLGIVLLSVMISIDKRLTQKAKAEKRIKRRRQRSETGAETASSETDSQPFINEASQEQP